MKEEETVSHPSEVRFHYHADWRTGLGAGGGTEDISRALCLHAYTPHMEWLASGGTSHQREGDRRCIVAP